MTETTSAFEAPDRVTALALAGQLRAQGFEVSTGQSPLTAEGRIVRVVLRSGQLPVVTAVAESVSGEIKLIEADEAAPGH